MAVAAWLQEHHKWLGLEAVVMVESTREVPRKTEHETWPYITSLALVGEHRTAIIRATSALGVWTLFRHDEGRVRTNHAQADFAAVKHMPAT